MNKLYNLARMTTATTGTGTITLGSAVSGYLTFALAGVADGDIVSYGIKDGSNSEVGTGTYTASGTALARTSITKSTNSNAAISLSGTAEVYITVRAEDFLFADIDRRNVLLERIYQAKSFGGYRRFLSAIADGYAASDGIVAGSSSNYSVDTSAKDVSPTVPANATPSTPTSGPLSFDGNTWVNRDVVLTNNNIVTKLGYYATTAGTVKLKILKQNSTTSFDIVVDQSFSHSGTGWQDFTITSPYTVPASGTYVLGAYLAAFGATTIYNASTNRSFINIDATGAGVTGWTANSAASSLGVRAVYAANNMTIVSTAQPSSVTASNCQALLEIDNTATPTLNTDLTVEVSCNGGTNWASATLANIGTGQSSRIVLETADTACTAGTSIQVRIKTFNNKSVPVYGMSLTWH